MAGGTASGKAILRVERLESSSGGPWRFDVSVTILTCTHASRLHREAVLDGVREDFSCCEWAIHPLPDACYRIAVGWRLTIKVVYVCEWGRDYFGEGWSDLQYMKERVIRRRPPRV